jgi:orotate phosphoribosyltransferase
MIDALATHADILGQASINYREEPFKLKGGDESHLFVDLRRGHSNPRLLQATGQLILDATQNDSFNAVAGTGIDGNAVVSGILLAAENGQGELQAFWGSDDKSGPSVYEDPKNGWGFRRTTPEGEPIMLGRRVLAVEGTLTTGGSLLTLVGMIREAGGIVTAAAAVVDRSNGRVDSIAAMLDGHPDTGEPMGIRTLFRLDESARMFVSAAQDL